MSMKREFQPTVRRYGTPRPAEFTFCETTPAISPYGLFDESIQKVLILH